MRLFFFLKATACIFIACGHQPGEAWCGMPVQMFCAGLPKRKPAHVYQFGLVFSAISIEVEVLVVDFLVFAVRADGLDGCVELFNQFGTALLEGDASARTMDFDDWRE